MFNDLTNMENTYIHANEVKAYPSVYSMNNGSIHSEENVRWITKRISEKSFIAASDQASFDIDCSESYKYDEFGKCISVSPVSMCIDGYLIKQGNPSNTSFDKYSANTNTVSIDSQILFVKELLGNLDPSIDSFAFSEYKSSDPMHMYNWRKLKANDDIVGRVKLSYEGSFVDQLSFNASNTYVFYDESYKIPMYNAGDAASKIANEKETNFAVYTLTGSTITALDIYYPVLYSKRKLAKTDDMPIEVPVIKFIDIFGFSNYLTYSVGRTKSYPSANSYTDFDENGSGVFGLFKDGNSILNADNGLVNFTNAKIQSAPNYLYDFTTLFNTYQEDDEEYHQLKPISDSVWESIPDKINGLNPFIIQNITSNYFNSTDTILKTVYGHYSQPDFCIGKFLPSGSNKYIKTNLDFYCINPSSLPAGTLQVIDILGVPTNVPVCFMTSDGNLCPTGVSVYDIDTDERTLTGQYPVEGYVHYIKRMYLSKYLLMSSITEDMINEVPLENIVSWSKDTTANTGSDDTRKFMTYYEPIAKCICLYMEIAYSDLIEQCSDSNSKKLVRHSGAEIHDAVESASPRPANYDRITTVDGVSITLPAKRSVFYAQDSGVTPSITQDEYMQKILFDTETDYTKLTGTAVDAYDLILGTYMIPEMPVEIDNRMKRYYRSISYTVKLTDMYNYFFYFENPFSYIHNCRVLPTSSDSVRAIDFPAYSVSISNEVCVMNFFETSENTVIDDLLIPVKNNQFNGINSDYYIDNPGSALTLGMMMMRPASTNIMGYDYDTNKSTCGSGFAYQYVFHTWQCEIPLIAKRNVDAHRYLIGSIYSSDLNERIYGGLNFGFDTWKNVKNSDSGALVFGAIGIGNVATNGSYDAEVPFISFEQYDLSYQTMRNSFIDIGTIYTDNNTNLYSYISDVVKQVSNDIVNSLLDSIIISTGMCGASAYYDVYSSGRVVIRGTGATSDYASQTSPLYHDERIKSVVVEEGITKLGDYLFKDCSNLESVTMSSTLATIGEYTFAQSVTDSGLVDLTIPNTLTTIGEYAFSVNNMISVSVPSTVTSIDSYAFYDCDKLKYVYIDCTTIPQFCFAACAMLKLGTITIGTHTTSILSQPFRYTQVTDIYYEGTLSDWNSITKSSGWDTTDSAPDSKLHTIHCTDGESKYENGSWVDYPNS